jgi:hypothetical protein
MPAQNANRSFLSSQFSVRAYHQSQEEEIK